MNRSPRTADEIRALVDLPRLEHEPGASARGALWWYPDDQYELATLQRIVAEGFAANRSVDYALNAGVPVSVARFRRGLERGMLTVRATGTITASIDGRPVPPASEITIDVGDAGGLIELTVETTAGSPPAVSDNAGDGVAWEFAVDGERWRPAHPRRSRELPPHLEREPSIALDLIRDGVLWATPVPLLGRVVVESDVLPVLRAGESREEALADDPTETRHDVVARAPGVWESVHELAVRWLRIDEGEPTHVRIEASVRPGTLRGAFLSSDDALNRIWAMSALTARLCMQRLTVDGLKRDRMPWVGDQALAVSANAYTWADAEIVRDSLTALGRPRNGYVNGIVDYSLWWVIAHRFRQGYFADDALLRREAADLDAFLARLEADAGDDGILRPSPDPDQFEPAGARGVFIDWNVTVDPDRESTALQVLWFWAQRTAAELLDGIGHPRATVWASRADATARTLRARGLDAEAGLWRAYLDGSGPDDGAEYPNFLAVLAELDGASTDAVRELLRTPLGGTPFMLSFALQARGLLGEAVGAVDVIRERWGAMLAHGAQTCWEEFGDSGSPWEMYGRRFGKSLAHGWSAGPAALLPELVLGIRPRSAGWRTFSVEAALGDLDWASAVVPTPHGDIVVRAEVGETTVDVPDGTTLLTPEAPFRGPVTVRRTSAGWEAL